MTQGSHSAAPQPFNSSLVPIASAHYTLDCHKLDETHYAGWYRPCQAKHAEKKKLKAEYRAQDKLYISTEMSVFLSLQTMLTMLLLEPITLYITPAPWSQKFIVQRLIVYDEL